MDQPREPAARGREKGEKNGRRRRSSCEDTMENGERNSREERTSGAVARDDEQSYDDSLITCYQCCKVLFALLVVADTSRVFARFPRIPAGTIAAITWKHVASSRQQNVDRVSRNQGTSRKRTHCRSSNDPRRGEQPCSHGIRIFSHGDSRWDETRRQIVAFARQL